MSDSVTPLDIEKKGLNWGEENTDTFKDWLKIASFNVQSLEYAIKEYKSIIQYSVILGLILSTASGTASSSRFGLEPNSSLDTGLNIAFVAMTFGIAICTGAIKVYQIQERLEEYIKTKQEWLNFITVIGTEFQLPLNLRQNAINLIIKHKDKYLDLLKRDLEIPERIKNRVLKENSWCDIDGKNISRTILAIAGSETKKIERRNSEIRIMVMPTNEPIPLNKKKSWFSFLQPPIVQQQQRQQQKRQQQEQQQEQQPPLHSRSSNDSPESIDYPPLNNFHPIQPAQISQSLPESPPPPNP